MSDLTDRQREVHAFIVEYGREHSRWPTIRDIGDHFGMNVNAVVGHLKALEKKGYVERPHDGTSRGIRVLKGVDGEALPVAVSLTRKEIGDALKAGGIGGLLRLQLVPFLCRRWGIK